MIGTRARLIKEARGLFWPWIVVVAAGTVRWVPVPAGWLADIGHFGLVGGLFVGLPLLATLAIGGEFHHGTMGMLLSQPIERTRLWAEKWIVVSAAVLSALLVYWPGVRSAYSAPMVEFAISTCLLVFLCSATFWTLVARSTVGGLILNTAMVSVVVTVLMVVLATSVRPASAALYTGVGLAATAYAFVMLWLGRRKFATFQVRGESAGPDFLTHSPTLRRILEAFLTCRPRGAFANLVRKEIRLQWPLWLLTILFILFPLALVPLRLLVGADAARGTLAVNVMVGVAGIHVLLATVLAGTSSLGDERESGTHSWHMTVPFSVRTQWLVKLAVAIFGSIVCVRAVLLAFTRVLGVSYPNVVNELFPEVFGIFVPVLTFAAFWFAGAVKGTIRAAAFVFPGIAAVGTAVAGGYGLAFWLWDSPAFLNLVAALYPFPPTGGLFDGMRALSNSGYAGLLWIVPLAALALFQSYRFFRNEAGVSVVPALPRLLLLALVGFLLMFSTRLPGITANVVRGNAVVALREVGDWVQLHGPGLGAAGTVELTLDDMVQASPMSARAQRWLEGARIAVTPMAYSFDAWIPGVGPGRREFSHYATVWLDRGWTCTVYPRGQFVPFGSCSSPEGGWRLGGGATQPISIP